MVFGFTVSKPGLRSACSRLEQILEQTLWKNSSHISGHLESQVQNSEVTASVLHVFCIVNVWVLQGVTVWRKFKLRQMSK
jgi:hypothetical protein